MTTLKTAVKQTTLKIDGGNPQPLPLNDSPDCWQNRNITVKIWDYLQTLQVTSSQSITMPSVVSPHAPSSTFLSPLPLTATVFNCCVSILSLV